MTIGTSDPHVRAWNHQLWGSGDQCHMRPKGLVEASFSTTSGRVAFLVYLLFHVL